MSFASWKPVYEIFEAMSQADQDRTGFSLMKHTFEKEQQRLIAIYQAAMRYQNQDYANWHIPSCECGYKTWVTQGDEECDYFCDECSDPLF